MSMFTIHYLFRMLTHVNIAFNNVYIIGISHFKFSLFQAYANTVTAFTFPFLNPAFLCLQLGLYSVKNVLNENQRMQQWWKYIFLEIYQRVSGIIMPIIRIQM
jgi:hypothetical protein